VADKNLQNFDCPFTDLFSNIKHFTLTEEGQVKLDYSFKKLNTLINHSNNAIENLLRGMQSLGVFLSFASQYKYLNDELQNLGMLISTISNLVEALNILNADISFELSKRSAQ